MVIMVITIIKVIMAIFVITVITLMAHSHPLSFVDIDTNVLILPIF